MESIDMAKYFLIALILFLVIDFLWIGIVAQKFYLEQMGPIAKLKDGKFDVNLYAAAAVYILLALAVVIFILPHSQTPLNALMLGAAFGLISYGIYDFTNLATLAAWNIKLALVDMAWGGVVCAVVSFLTKYVSKFL